MSSTRALCSYRNCPRKASSTNGARQRCDLPTHFQAEHCGPDCPQARHHYGPCGAPVVCHNCRTVLPADATTCAWCATDDPRGPRTSSYRADTIAPTESAAQYQERTRDLQPSTVCMECSAPATLHIVHGNIPGLDTRYEGVSFCHAEHLYRWLANPTHRTRRLALTNPEHATS